MPAANPGAEAVNATACNDFAIVDCQQVETVVLLGLLLEILAPGFDTWIRRLQQAGKNLRITHQPYKCRRVVRRRTPVVKACHRRCCAHDCTLASALRSLLGSLPPAIAMSARPPPLPPTCCAT